MIETLNKLSKDELVLEVVNQKSETENLKHQVSILQKMLFGSRQDQHKAIENPEQTDLEFTEKVDLDLPQDIEAQKAIYHRKAKNTKRTDYSKLEIPADLERVVTVIELLDKTEDMIKIGEEVIELLAITLINGSKKPSQNY